RPLPPHHNRLIRECVVRSGVKAQNRRRSESLGSYDLPDGAGHVFKRDTLITQASLHHRARHTIYYTTALRFREDKSALGFDPGRTLFSIRTHSGHDYT